MLPAPLVLQSLVNDECQYLNAMVSVRNIVPFKNWSNMRNIGTTCEDLRSALVGGRTQAREFVASPTVAFGAGVLKLDT